MCACELCGIENASKYNQAAAIHDDVEPLECEMVLCQSCRDAIEATTRSFNEQFTTDMFGDIKQSEE